MYSDPRSGLTLTQDITPASDEHRALATITMAFSDDPVARWFLPDAHLYLTYWPQVVKAFGEAAFANGTADSIDDCGGVALWLPPGAEPDEEALGALAAEAVPASDQEEVFDFMGQLGNFHPTEPHWFLPFIGVDAHQAGPRIRLGATAPCA